MLNVWRKIELNLMCNNGISKPNFFFLNLSKRKNKNNWIVVMMEFLKKFKVKYKNKNN